MNFTDLILEVPNALPDDFCDELIQRFEEDTENQYQGVSGRGINREIKDSIDIFISCKENWVDADQRVFNYVKSGTDQYSELFNSKVYPPEAEILDFICDEGYQIQRSSVDGHYTWHHDHNEMIIMDTIHNDDGIKSLRKSRIYTFIFYLNDSSEFGGGRTQFFFDGEIHSVTPKKGLALWFPANILYTHRGEVVTSGKKYLMTGWIHKEFNANYSSTSPQSVEYRKSKGEDNMLFPLNPSPNYKLSTP